MSARLITEREAAAMLGINPKLLRQWRWRCTGACPPFVKLGRSVRYDIADLERYIAEHKHEQPVG